MGLDSYGVLALIEMDDCSVSWTLVSTKHGPHLNKKARPRNFEVGQLVLRCNLVLITKKQKESLLLIGRVHKSLEKYYREENYI